MALKNNNAFVFSDNALYEELQEILAPFQKPLRIAQGSLGEFMTAPLRGEVNVDAPWESSGESKGLRPMLFQDGRKTNDNGLGLVQHHEEAYAELGILASPTIIIRDSRAHRQEEIIARGAHQYSVEELAHVVQADIARIASETAQIVDPQRRRYGRGVYVIVEKKGKELQKLQHTLEEFGHEVYTTDRIDSLEDILDAVTPNRFRVDRVFIGDSQDPENFQKTLLALRGQSFPVAINTHNITRDNAHYAAELGADLLPHPLPPVVLQLFAENHKYTGKTRKNARILMFNRDNAESLLMKAYLERRGYENVWLHGAGEGLFNDAIPGLARNRERREDVLEFFGKSEEPLDLLIDNYDVDPADAEQLARKARGYKTGSILWTTMSNDTGKLFSLYRKGVVNAFIEKGMGGANGMVDFLRVTSNTLHTGTYRQNKAPRIQPDETAHLAVIDGPPGAGKTAIQETTYHQLRSQGGMGPAIWCPIKGTDRKVKESEAFTVYRSREEIQERKRNGLIMFSFEKESITGEVHAYGYDAFETQGGTLLLATRSKELFDEIEQSRLPLHRITLEDIGITAHVANLQKREQLSQNMQTTRDRINKVYEPIPRTEGVLQHFFVYYTHPTRPRILAQQTDMIEKIMMSIAQYAAFYKI